MQDIKLEGNKLYPKTPKRIPLKRNKEINYTLDGTAWSTGQTVGVKHIFNLMYSACEKTEKETLESLFSQGGKQSLVWHDGETYDVIWGSEFGLTDVISTVKGLFSGMIQLYEV